LRLINDRTTALVILSALIAVLLCLAPQTHDKIPFSIINAGAHIADVLFHELGHTLFYWLSGYPAIPMIFTLFGADQAGGMALTFGHSWAVQIGVWVALAYFIYFFYDHNSRWFIAVAILLAISLINAISDYDTLLATYMGHGGSILMGGFFLFRAWIYLDARNQFERWLNGFFGFYLILSNIQFSYNLIYDAAAKILYSQHAAFGAMHNDFMAMTEMIYGLSMDTIATFTIVYGFLVIIGAYALAAYLSDEFEYAVD
jgi:hypothetical protein